MKYYEDPLLNSKQYTLNGETLNIYSALLNKKDFETKRPLNNFPYVIMNNLNCDLNELNNLITSLERYVGFKIKTNIIRMWLLKKRFPLPLLRVLSLNKTNSKLELANLIKDIKGFTNNFGTVTIRLPLKYSKLLLDKHIYFHGYLLGDGCISKDLIKLSDGHLDSSKLEDSKQLMVVFKQYLKKTYNLNSEIKKIGNCYHLITSRNKFLSRYIKFFYGYNKNNEIIDSPLIIKDKKEKIKIFLRGFFDADAGIQESSNSIILKSKDNNFLKFCKSFLEKEGLFLENVRYDSKKVSYIHISSTELLKYSNVVGFNHNRKKRILLNRLKNDCPLRIFSGTKKDFLIENKYFDFTKFKDVRLIGVHNIFKDNRHKIGTQEKVSRLLNIPRRTVGKYETGTHSIPIGIFLKVVKTKNKMDLINLLSKNNVKFCVGNNKGAIELPFSINEVNFDILKYMAPTTNKIIIRRYGTININNKINKKRLFKKIEEDFSVKVFKDVNSYIVTNTTLSKFLSTFFIYKPAWKGLINKELAILDRKLSVHM